MALSLFVVISWYGLSVTCYYAIRPIPSKSIRFLLTFLLCVLISSITCGNLPQVDMTSLLLVGASWMISLRLIQLTVFSSQTSLTFQSFSWKMLWGFFPILPKKSARNQWPIIFHLILMVMKFFFNHWIYRWSIRCNTGVTPARIVMLYLGLISISYIFDAQMILVRILTRDKYTLESFTHFPLFSSSLREFWGQRYNRFVNIIFKESVFQPLQEECSSSVIAALTVFIISGLLHVHVLYVAFGNTYSLFPTFMFFFLHGIACCLEATMKFQFAKHVGWVGTHVFLLITAPLMLEPFMKEESSFYIKNGPPFRDVEWVPKLPVPNFCPQ